MNTDFVETLESETEIESSEQDGMYAIACGDLNVLASLNIIHRSKNPADLPLPAKAYLGADQDKALTVLWLPEDGRFISIGRASLDSNLKPRFEIEDSAESHRGSWQSVLSETQQKS